MKKMRKYCYSDPSGDFVVDEKYIINTYYDFWKNQLLKLGRDHLISRENCIQDWVIVNWAHEVTFDH